MKKLLLSLSFLFVSISLSFSQTCAGDAVIIEEENLTVWEVATNGRQVFSLAGFRGDITIQGVGYFQEDIGLGDTGLILMAHDTLGTFEWALQLPGSSFFTTNPALAATSTDVYVSATSVENNGTEHHFNVLQYSAANGAPGWSNSYVVPNTTTSILPFQAQVYPYSADIDGNNNLIISGAFADSLKLNADTLFTPPGVSETFVMSLNATTGVENWATQSTGSAGRARAWTVGVTPGNEIVLGGHFTSSVNFGGTAFTAPDSTINPFIAKLNPLDGSQVWLRGFLGQTPNSFNNIYDVDFDSGGNIYFAGSFNDAIDVLGTVISNPISGGGPVDVEAMMGALDTNGNLVWVNQLGGPSTSDEFATTVVYSASSGSVYVGAQLVTDSLHYGGLALNLPPVAGHYVFGVSPIDGTIDAIPANNISFESTFGYSAVYDDLNNKYIAASIVRGNGKNAVVKQWIPNRPVPLVDVTQETGVLDPTETLTAFDPGGGTYLYQWYQNGNLLAGETLPTFTATINGEYYVEITSAAGGCSINSQSFFLLDGSTLESDSLALVELYNNTDGPNWLDNTNWLVGNVNTWFGVGVSGGRVTNLTLNSNNLNGQFPQSLPSLAQLTNLDLGGNNISGSLPDNIGNMTQLTGFAIWGNQMSGPIPDSFGNLINLGFFFATDNNFSGPLPATIGNLTLLEGLAFNNNQITGPFPASIGNLVNATYFEFVNNPINDVIPPEIGNMSALQFIQLDNAQITGTLPTTIGNLTNLVAFNAGGNQISGPLPVEIVNLSNLQILNLNLNPINSAIPTEYGELLSLISINFESCQLQGTFPDAIWQIPTIESIYLSGNTNLSVPLPTNLNTLTQLVDIRIDQTLPKGGAFPTGFYSLPNLVGLSLGGKQYEGTLDGTGVDNWTNLDNIYLWANNLSGDLPAEFATLPNLRALNVSGNSFQNIPAFDATIMQELGIDRNQLDFNSIIPNLGVANFAYIPQFSRENQYLEVAQGGDLTLVNEYTTAGNQYEWVRNVTDSALSANRDLTITGATLADLGGYRAIVTNPDVPDLTLFTPFYNVAFSGPPASFTVDNNPNSVADFKSLYAAIYGTNANDTLYIMGSKTPYNLGGKLFELPRVVYGPGYFLSENPATQASTDSAYVNQLLFKKGAEGSQVYGLNIGSVFLNNQSSAINDTLRDVTISHNKIRDLSFSDDNQGHTVSKNFISYLNFTSTPLRTNSRSYQDITISNNIVDTVTTVFVRATAQFNVMQNIVFDRNTIGLLTDSLENIILTNNIINTNEATVIASETGTIDFATANFENTSGTLSIDNDYQTTATAGAFSGLDPYVLSGIAPIPRVFQLNDIGRIRLDTRATSDENVIIEKLNYRLGEAGTIVQRGTVVRIEPADTVDVLFRPRLGNVTPNETVRIMLWPKDANGVRGVPQALEFVAETTTASGQIFETGGGNVTNGDVLLFEINQEATAFDTLSTTLNANGNYSFSNIVIGDYLLLAKADTVDFPGYLPTYFSQSDLWEEADTIEITNTNPVNNITLLAKPQEATGDGAVAGFIEEEIVTEGTGGRLENRRRVKNAGVSMRRRVRTGKTEDSDFEYVLFAYVESNENGEFTISNLPPDFYRINIQYPGFPMDTLSNIDIEIGETVNDSYELSAVVADGKIAVTVLSTTGLFDEVVEKITVYPNPTTSEGINVRFLNYAQLDGKVSMELLDVKGNLVNRQTIDATILLQGEDVKMPFTNARPGTYILRITQKNNEIGQARIIVR